MDEPERPFHALAAEEVLASLEVRPDAGLSAAEVGRRRRRYGPNQLEERKPRSGWHILYEQFASVVVMVMAVAATLALLLGRWMEGSAILAVIVVNAALGFITEWRAVRSMEALRALARPTTWVRRGGKEQALGLEALVPGDVVLLEGGDRVPADMRLLEANALVVDESVLTGESVPVNKQLEPVAPDQPLAERRDMLYRGTTLVQGSALGVVTATGMASELGRIAELVAGAEEELTPLERQLNTLGRRLALVVIGVAAVVAIAGLLAGQPPVLMVETAIALGVAAVPEGLPIVATIALARGMWLMARRNALINRLPAVETLGATQVIFTDKTGTLTENRMTLRRVVAATSTLEFTPSKTAGGNPIPQGDPDLPLRLLLEVAVLCNNARLEGEAGAHGDPTEVALLRGGAAVGLHRAELLERWPEVREVPFDSDTMMMATYHRVESGAIMEAVKGAPGAVLKACSHFVGAEGESLPLDEAGRERLLETARREAGRGLRLLAMADREVADEQVEPYEGLCWLGLAGLEDPPREGVREALEECRRAGVRVVMVTGDQPDTAAAIARSVGFSAEGEGVLRGAELKEPETLTQPQRERILATSVFARVSPEQKLRLVQLFQQQGLTVAMTGDGVNDTPALKQADIGVAMGLRGTDAAREVGDIVLKDDAFYTIVAAVEQGRIIFGNIRKSVLFMLCTNIAEILAVTAASLAGAPLPLLPLQILYLNLVTDIFPALALGAGEGDPGIMDRPPRAAREEVLTSGHWWAIGGWSLLIATCVLGGLAIALRWLGFDTATAVTVSFLVLAFSKLWFVFNLRSPGTTLADNDIVDNGWIWGAIGLCVALLLCAVYLPGLSTILATRPLDAAGWVLVLGGSAVPFVVGQARRGWQRAAAIREGSS